MEQMPWAAASTENVHSLHEILQQDAQFLQRVSANCLNSSPLHVAASRGKAEFVTLLLQTNSELAGALDSRQRSPLHLAAANGFLGIVRELVNVSPEICQSRDRDGANPLHLAAMKGKVEVLDELVEKYPHAALARVDGGATVLHLCVIHNQLEALTLLLEKILCLQLVNAKDDNGNTILHLAVMYKRFQIVECVLKKSKIDVNATNASRDTAMDILSLAKGSDTWRDEEKNGFGQMEVLLAESTAKEGKSLVQDDWVTLHRDPLMVVASLTATMAFQAGVNPPGGVWQEDNDKHRAGEAVMASKYPHAYNYFMQLNNMTLALSLSTILLLMTDLPFRRKFSDWILWTIVSMAIYAAAFTYETANIMIVPGKERFSFSDTSLLVIIACGLLLGGVALTRGVLSKKTIKKIHND